MAQHVLKVMAGPAAGVKLESTFNAVGGFVTEKLTFIKINHTLITADYKTSTAEVINEGRLHTAHCAFIKLQLTRCFHSCAKKLPLKLKRWRSTLFIYFLKIH